jgi:hypothetical protein
MKWVEIIKLQVAEIDRESVKHQLPELMSKVDHNSGLYDVKVYHNALVSSDLSINLYWKSGKVEPQGSATGLGLIYVLKTFGLISHSVWIEQ